MPEERDVFAAAPDAFPLAGERWVTMAFVHWLAMRSTQCYVRNRVRQEYSITIAENLRARLGSQEVEIACADIAALGPSAQTLREVEEAWAEAVLIPAARESLDAALRFDGAGVRLDAEFKLCRRVSLFRCFPYRCTFAARGVRGMYLALPYLCQTGERAKAYVDFLLPLFRRRHLCAALPRAGLPAFVAVDSPEKFGGAILVALAMVWPEYMLRDPEQQGWTWKQLLAGGSFTHAVIVCADPPHRLWRIEKAAFPPRIPQEIGGVSGPSRSFGFRRVRGLKPLHFM